MGTLIEKIQNLHELPAFPSVLAKLLNLMGNQEVEMTDIEQLIITDPALTLNVMRIANSAAFAGPQRVNSLSLGIARIGTSALQRIVIAQQSATLFKAGAQGFGLDAKACWGGSMAGALATEAIARHCGSVDQKVAFTAGLLRDCGTLLMDCLESPESVQRVLSSNTQLSVPEREMQSFGFDHAQVGAALAEHWNLPLELIEAIRFHYAPPNETPIPLVDCVHCGDLIAKQLGYGIGLDGLSYSFSQASHDRLELDYATMIGIMADVRMQMEDFQLQMDAAHGEQAA